MMPSNVNVMYCGRWLRKGLANDNILKKIFITSFQSSAVSDVKLRYLSFN